MEWLYAGVVGILTAAGVYLLLESRIFSVVLGLLVISYAVNLFLFATGRLHTNEPPMVDVSSSPADPLPQALVLTAIVIGFATTALLLVLALRVIAGSRSDHVDASEEEAR